MSEDSSIEVAFKALQASNPGTDVLLISHEINKSLYFNISKQLGRRNGNTKKSRCIVFLNTHGGDPHAAFRIARCFKYHYGKVRLVVPNMCKSAGTLIAIGADEIAIGDLGELGPLDVQISNRKEIFERSSGLDYTEALRAIVDHAQSTFRSSLLDIRAGAGISTKMAGEFASQLAIGVVAPMYAQIDPIQVGEVHRAMKIAYEYGDRLNSEVKSLKRDALLSLVSGYPDHSFVIDRKEAKGLFNKVEALTTEEVQFVDKVWEVLKKETSQCLLFDIEPSDVKEEHEHPVSSGTERADKKPVAVESAVASETADVRPNVNDGPAPPRGNGADSDTATGASQPTVAASRRTRRVVVRPT